MRVTIPSAIQGARLPGRQISWFRSDGTPENLTGATLTARVKNQLTGEARDVTGVLNVTDPTNGVFTWAFSSEDVAVAGDYDLQFTASFGSLSAKTFAATWSVYRSV